MTRLTISPLVWLIWIIAVAFTFGRPPETSAQSSTATLSGIVKDEKGAVIAGANLTLVSVDTGLKHETEGNADGYFVITSLRPGRYTLTVQHQGFSVAEDKNVVLNVNDYKSLRIELKVGQVKESVTVEGISLIQTESGAVSTLVDRKTIDFDGARGGAVETPEQVQQRGLARARRPHERHEVAARQIQVEFLEHRHHFIAALILLGDATQARDHRIQLFAFHCRHDVVLC